MKKHLFLIFLPLFTFGIYAQQAHLDSALVFRIYGNSESSLSGYMTSINGQVYYPLYDYQIWTPEQINAFVSQKVAELDSVYKLELAMLKTQLVNLKSELASLKKTPNNTTITPDTISIKWGGQTIEYFWEK